MVDHACSAERTGASCSYATEYQELTCVAGIIWRELMDECCILCYKRATVEMCLKASIMQNIPAFQDAREMRETSVSELPAAVHLSAAGVIMQDNAGRPDKQAAPPCSRTTDLGQQVGAHHTMIKVARGKRARMSCFQCSKITTPLRSMYGAVRNE